MQGWTPWRRALEVFEPTCLNFWTKTITDRTACSELQRAGRLMTGAKETSEDRRVG